jgi:hypothetical protein
MFIMIGMDPSLQCTSDHNCRLQFLWIFALLMAALQMIHDWTAWVLFHSVSSSRRKSWDDVILISDIILYKMMMMTATSLGKLSWVSDVARILLPSCCFSAELGCSWLLRFIEAPSRRIGVHWYIIIQTTYQRCLWPSYQPLHLCYLLHLEPSLTQTSNLIPHV